MYKKNVIIVDIVFTSAFFFFFFLLVFQIFLLGLNCIYFCYKGCNFPSFFFPSGCFLAVNNSEKFIDLSLLEENEDYYERNLFHLKPQNKVTQDILNTLQQNKDKVMGVLIYGHQGKSKHTGVWTIPELLASNSQLIELGPNRSIEEYIVPEGGVEQGLCGQIVRIFRSDEI